MKRNIAYIAVFVAALALTWPVYLKVVQARREAAYSAAIAPFQRDLRIGMARADVEKYLDSRHVRYYLVRVAGSDGPTYEIEVGEESFICEWNVYVALEFGAADTLTLIHVKKEGTCL
jgi:hypothetical protein